MKKIVVILIVVIVCLIGYKAFGPTLKRTNKTPVVRSDCPITLIESYKSDLYSFSLPDGFVYCDNKCDKDDAYGGECVQSFRISPTSLGGNSAYLGLADVSVIKGIKNVNIGGQICVISYNIESSKWQRECSSGAGLIYEDAQTNPLGKNIVSSLTNGGSHGNRIYQFITNKEKDLVFILSEPQTRRVRCDFSDELRKTACEKALQSAFPKTESSSVDDAWIAEEFYAKVYKNTDRLLESYKWED